MRVAAVILAAGAGTRLGGAAKALLGLADGRTFLRAVVETARGAGVEEIVVVVAAPHEEATAAEARVLGVETVRNERPEDGMISSIVSGLGVAGVRAIGDDAAALVWPVDHPLVAVATVRALVAAADADAIVLPGPAAHPGHPALFGAAAWPALAAAARDGRTARDVALAWPRVIHLGLASTPASGDVDTPEDYARIRQQGPR